MAGHSGQHGIERLEHAQLPRLAIQHWDQLGQMKGERAPGGVLRGQNDRIQVNMHDPHAHCTGIPIQGTSYVGPLVTYRPLFEQNGVVSPDVIRQMMYRPPLAMGRYRSMTAAAWKWGTMKYRHP